MMAGAALTEVFGDAPEPPPELGAFTADAFAGQPLPARLWNVPGMIPHGTVTTLDGDGGTGKSTLALQLAVATVLGREWLGRQVMQGRVMYASAEDDSHELHRRLNELCVHFDAGLEELSDLKILPFADKVAELVVTDERSRKLVTTPVWEAVKAEALAWQPVLMILDSRADFYGGDEINRNQVRAFVSMNRRLAQEVGFGLLMLSHPSLTGMANGSGSSGSTAWNNSVRSRLYFRKPKADDGEALDPDLRVLSMPKANYGPEMPEVRLRRGAGVFRLAEGEATGPIDKAAAQRKVDAIFLEMLSAYDAQGRHVSDRPGANYAPTVFARDPAAKGASRRGLEGAMNRLFATGRISVEMIGRPSKQVRKLSAVAPVREAVAA